VAWHPVHQALPTHKKTLRLMRCLNISRPTAVGSMVMLWTWAIDNAPGGDVTGLESEDFAEIMSLSDLPQVAELLPVLLECGWVEQCGDSLCLHDWDDYGGRYEASKAASRERQRNLRERRRDQSVPYNSGNGDVTVTSPLDNELIPVTSLREEKSTEEKSTEENKTKKTKGVQGESNGAVAPAIILPSSDVDPRIFEVLDILGQPHTPNNVKYVGLKIVENSNREPVSRALEAHEHIKANPKKQYKFPLRVWGNWMGPPPWEKKAAAENGASSNGKHELTPAEIAELEDPDHTGTRTTGWWPIPQGTKAPPSSVPEWGQALQRLIDGGKVNRRDYENILCRIQPQPRQGDTLRLVIPRDNFTVTHVKETLNWPIREALQECARGLRPVYRVQGDDDDLTVRFN
jgi:hypothetical protein